MIKEQAQLTHFKISTRSEVKIFHLVLFSLVKSIFCVDLLVQFYCRISLVQISTLNSLKGFCFLPKQVILSYKKSDCSRLV